MAFEYQSTNILDENLAQARASAPPGTSVSIPGSWDDKTAFYYNNLAENDKRAYETALFNYQNEYNSPIEEFKRYQAAGVNPYAAIGSNKSVQAPTAGAPQATAHKYQESANKLSLANSLIQNILGVTKGVLDFQKMSQQIQYNHEAFPMLLEALGLKNLDLDWKQKFAPWRYGWSAINSGLGAVEQAALLGIKPNQLGGLFTPVSGGYELLSPEIEISPNSLFSQQYKTMFDLRKKEMWKKEQDVQMRKNELQQRKDEFHKKTEWRLFDEDHARNVLQETKRYHQALETLGKAGLAIKGVSALLPW